MKLTIREIETIEKIFAIPYAEEIYGGNMLSYFQECEKIKQMTEQELRAKYPAAYYWLDKWRPGQNET